MKMKKINFVSLVIVLALSFITLSVASAAWRGPSTTPPDGNAEPPINVSSAPQFKSGDFTLGNYFRVMNYALIGAPTNPGEPLSPNLTLDVEGNVGAKAYCDNNGTNCKTIVELGGGVTGGSGGGFWALNSNGIDIYNTNNRNVGIGTNALPGRLGVLGTINSESGGDYNYKLTEANGAYGLAIHGTNGNFRLDDIGGGREANILDITNSVAANSGRVTANDFCLRNGTTCLSKATMGTDTGIGTRGTAISGCKMAATNNALIEKVWGDGDSGGTYAAGPACSGKQCNWFKDLGEHSLCSLTTVGNHGPFDDAYCKVFQEGANYILQAHDEVGGSESPSARVQCGATCWDLSCS